MSEADIEGAVAQEITDSLRMIYGGCEVRVVAVMVGDVVHCAVAVRLPVPDEDVTMTWGVTP